MAKKQRGVWGIDVGHAALKALRCEALDSGQIVATAFDYIEYPKMLDQPEADPAQLVRDALGQFFSRNEVRGDDVAISVPGQSGLTKFFKPPPVDPKRIGDIVKYEARQQIPFSLDEVVWDYQRMAGGMEVEGLIIDAEVGLFAMKRDQVYRAMRPFDEAGVELDLIQLAPLCLYNFVSYDVLTDLPDEAEYDADNPPESLAVLDVGTDATDLVITNGFRVWQRSVPVGGNHFTKQLSRQFKLTFAKAEQLKRTARQAKDPKAVFQAMRPVFNDLVTEIQRSIGYFQGIDRQAKIGGVLLLGNGSKLPGLQQFLAKSLGYRIVDFKSFSRLDGRAVLTARAFQDNVRSFGVSYGLCLQGLGRGRLATNLVPREILTDRMIRAKKPWAVAAVSALLLACAFNFFFHFRSWRQVHPERVVQDVAWKQALDDAAQAAATSNNYISLDQQKVQHLEHLKAIGREVSGNAERRVLWMELLKAVNQALPRDPDFRPDEIPDVRAKPFPERKDVFIEHMESEWFDDLATWYSPDVKQLYLQALEARGERPEDATEVITPGMAGPDMGADMGLDYGSEPPSAYGGPGAAAPAGPAPGAIPGGEEGPRPPVDAGGLDGPTGPGWVIELKGFHFYGDSVNGRARYVRRNILEALEKSVVQLPVGPGQTDKFTMKELGIGYAIVVRVSLDQNYRVRNPYYTPPVPQPGQEGTPGVPSPFGAAGPAAPFPAPAGQPAAATPAPAGQPAAAEEGAPADAGDPNNVPFFPAPKYSFTVQFVWQPRLLSERLEARRLAQQQQQEAQPVDQAAPPGPAAGGAPPAAPGPGQVQAPSADVPSSQPQAG